MSGYNFFCLTVRHCRTRPLLAFMAALIEQLWSLWVEFTLIIPRHPACPADKPQLYVPQHVRPLMLTESIACTRVTEWRIQLTPVGKLQSRHKIHSNLGVLMVIFLNTKWKKKKTAKGEWVNQRTGARTASTCRQMKRDYPPFFRNKWMSEAPEWVNKRVNMCQLMERTWRPPSTFFLHI